MHKAAAGKLLPLPVVSYIHNRKALFPERRLLSKLLKCLKVFRNECIRGFADEGTAVLLKAVIFRKIHHSIARFVVLQNYGRALLIDQPRDLGKILVRFGHGDQSVGIDHHGYQSSRQLDTPFKILFT